MVPIGKEGGPPPHHHRQAPGGGAAGEELLTCTQAADGGADLDYLPPDMPGFSQLDLRFIVTFTEVGAAGRSGRGPDALPLEGRGGDLPGSACLSSLEQKTRGADVLPSRSPPLPPLPSPPCPCRRARATSSGC